MARLVDAYRGARIANVSSDAAPVVDVVALERVLAALYARGRATYPDFVVEDAVFAAHLRRCGAAIETDGIADIHAEDLFLCCAGLLGDEAAVRVLRSRARVALTTYLRQIDPSLSFLEEVEQRLWDAALVGSVEAAPKLASYAGRGPLLAWVGVVAQRIALMIRRSEATEKRVLDNVALDARLVSSDPELTFLKEHLRQPFQRAIVQALRSLDDRQRMIYTLHVVDGLTVERIAALYGVSHSTVSRWMAAARAAIVATARRILGEEMQLSAEEFESLVGLLLSQLDLSVSGLFRKPA